MFYVFASVAYYSEIGTLSLNMAFNSERSTTVQLTKITLKVTSYTRKGNSHFGCIVVYFTD